uniref:Odorant-binding protein 27 n=1 Tax=Pyrrhalta maculicollis TaxID=226885 RepID=A0A1J0KKE9_9CUCU|nr:odorant-binding protein 27 [Pyrrhalta maculicollis]
MKSLLVCLLIITLAMTDETKDLIEEALISCGAEIEGPNNIGTLVVQENADETKLGTILFCANKKIGLQHDNGEINIDVLENLMETGNRDEATAKKILDCGRSKGDNGAAKAFNFLKCHELAVRP